MKLKNLFYLLLALPLAFASCETLTDEEQDQQQNQQEEPSKEPKLTVTSPLEVEVDAESSTNIISYKLENAPEGATVTVTCEAEWIENIDIKADKNQIWYKVLANDGDAREATIVISYEEQSFNVVVKQAAKPASTVLRFEVTSEPTIEFDCNAFSGSIGYILENPIEGVEVAAVSNQDWVEVTAIVDGAIDFTAQANEGEAREATITITYGILDPVVITLKQAQYIDPSEVVDGFVITECWASSENGGKQWDVTFVEHDATLGDMYTRISFALAEANVQRVTDGTYSVADGTILLNTAVENGYSTYRHNSSETADILDATFTVATDTNAKTISINGTFKVGDKNIEIKYNGDMRGMDLGEATTGAIERTEWDFFYIYSQWDDTKYVVAYDTNKIKYEWHVKKLGGTKNDPLAAGEYVVGEWESTTTRDYIDNTASRINNTNLVSGVVNITVVEEGYNFTFDVTDENGTNWKGTYVGAIDPDLYNSNPYAPKTF